MIAKFAATQFVDQRGKVPMTLSMVPEGIMQVSKQFRDCTLREFYAGRDFSIQVPRDIAKLRRIHGPEDLMNIDRLYPNNPKEITDILEQAAEKVVSEIENCVEACASFGLVQYHHVESIHVVFSGRFSTIGTPEYVTCYWSFIFGFKAFDTNRRPDEQRQPDYQINADGNLDWEDLNAVRLAYARKLFDMLTDPSTDLGMFLRLEDVLLHPAVQHVVKELCLMGAMGAPALGWVEVILEMYDDYILRERLGMAEYHGGEEGWSDEDED